MLDKKLSTSQKYVVLALAAEEVVRDRSVVFHYYGPSQLKRTAKKLAKGGLHPIINGTYSLEDEINETIEDKYPFFRKTYLISQVKSLRNLLSLKDTKLVGDKLVCAVNDILGINLRKPYDISRIEKEIRPTGRGNGSGFSKITNRIIREWIEELIRQFKTDMIHKLFLGRDFEAFLNKSTVEVAHPKKGYPPDYYVYRGSGRGLMCISNDHRKDKATAMGTIMHELCPGHHIYYLYREFLLKRGLVGEDAALDLIYSSETPVSEGIAENTFFHISMADQELLGQIRETICRDQFRKKVLYNAWHHLFVNGSMTKKKAGEYLVEEGCFAEDKVKMWLQFIDDWRIYYPAYPLGASRIRQNLNNFPRQGIYYLYVPKSIPVLDKLETAFRERREP